MLSQPLTKAIQTTEGALVVVSGVAVAVTSAVDPSALPHKYAAIVIAAQNVALLIQRGVIKSVALSSGLGVVPQPKASLSKAHVALITDAAVSAAETVEKVFVKPESASKPDPEPVPTVPPVSAPAPAASVSDASPTPPASNPLAPVTPPAA